jgi:hypothetical protein
MSKSQLSQDQEAVSVKPVSRGLDRVKVVSKISAWLPTPRSSWWPHWWPPGLGALIDATVRFADRAGGFRPRRKVRRWCMP